MKLEKIIIPIQQILPPSLETIGKEKYETEIRLHPLLKWFWAAVSTVRVDYKPYFIPDLTELMTPRVHFFTNPKKHAPQDPLYKQIQVNDAICFPNLWAWTKMAICRITGSQEESILLKDIKTKQFYDAFICSQQFFQAHHKLKPNEKSYPSVNMNYLRPSASSILHPHYQLLNLPIPTPLLALILQESSNYYKKNKQNFFNAYSEQERNGPRWIGEVGTSENRISFLAPWAPLAGPDEVLFISDSFTAFPLPEQVWQNIAEGLHKIFIGYHEMGVRSINFIICSDVYGSQNKFFRLFGMVWSRPLKNLDISDRGYAEIAYKISLTFRSPEMVASDIRKYW